MDKPEENQSTSPRKNPNLAWIIDPHTKLTKPDFSVTATSCRVSADQIHSMSKKVGKFIKSVNSPHPLLDLLDEKKTLTSPRSGRKSEAEGTKATSVAGHDDSGSNAEDFPETISLKSKAPPDIHRALRVQQLIENRRRFFDGEAKATPEFGTVLVEPEASEADDDFRASMDSRRGSLGSSMGEKVEDLLETTEESLRDTSHGYSAEEDEASEEEDLQRVLGRKALQNLKTRNYLKPKVDSSKKPVDTFKKLAKQRKKAAKESSRFFPRFGVVGYPSKSILKGEKTTMLINSYRPESRGKKQLRFDPKQVRGIQNVLNKNKKPSKKEKKDKRLLQKINEWDIYGGKNLKLALKLLGDDSSSDESPEPIPNLRALTTSGPAPPSPRSVQFSMTEVIRTGREVEKRNDLSLALSSDPKKEAQDRYGPIVEVATRTTPHSPRTPRSARSTGSQRQNSARSTRQTSLTPTTPVMSEDELKGPRLSTPIPVKINPSVYETYEKMIQMGDVEKTSAYVDWKLNPQLNGVLPPLRRFTTTKFDETRIFGKSRSDRILAKEFNIDIETRVSSIASARIPPTPYQAFRGQSRPPTQAAMEKDFVQMKIEEPTIPVKPPTIYNRLQMKREDVLPGDVDYSLDPRYLGLLEILVPCYETRTPIWKNAKPAPAVEPSGEEGDGDTEQVTFTRPVQHNNDFGFITFPPKDPRHIPLGPTKPKQ